MNLRTILLANAAAVVICASTMLASPASAGEGWYLGVGAGWDELRSPTIGEAGHYGQLGTREAPIVAGTLGYKLHNLPIRLEAEAAWDSHDTRSFAEGGTVYPGTGHAEVRSLMGNALYDFHVAPRLKLSLGGGIGVGEDRTKFVETGGPGEFSTAQRSGLMWQGIGGATFETTRNLDVFVEYHYRDLRNSSSDTTLPYVAHNLTENVVMAGVRWYPWAPTEVMAATYMPPPVPPAPPPPPMPPPAPVKTFIVFFDFNKSDLTAEAQNVVAEAVKEAARANAVRIVVTGHTDTVGSDTYNQALSERRAETVKNEMIREGMKADDISTVGKSFHDPLVATGPGVREPQNRRAVIDLG